MFKPVDEQGLTDIHCHILPYVDDGARTLAEAKKMILQQIDQGVSNVFVTPHLRKDQFETSDENLRNEFENLYKFTQDKAIKIHLSREYFCDDYLINLLEKGEVMPLSEHKHILVEFSSFHSEEYIINYTKQILNLGYIPILAHIERYKIFYNRQAIRELIDLGAKIQVNSECVLGKLGFTRKRLVMHLIKNNSVHFIASDCHRTDVRLPNLGNCAKYLSKKISKKQFEQIFYANPRELSKIKLEI
ncbi:MAG: CpsB/CapC family capsule biosynthesis tyrosine phosphatase [Clostridia bacterium]